MRRYLRHFCYIQYLWHKYLLRYKTSQIHGLVIFRIVIAHSLGNHQFLLLPAMRYYYLHSTLQYKSQLAIHDYST